MSRRQNSEVRLTFLSKVSLNHSKAYILNRCEASFGQSESHLMKMHMHLRNITNKQQITNKFQWAKTLMTKNMI